MLWELQTAPAEGSGCLGHRARAAAYQCSVSTRTGRHHCRTHWRHNHRFRRQCRRPDRARTVAHRKPVCTLGTARRKGSWENRKAVARHPADLRGSVRGVCRRTWPGDKYPHHLAALSRIPQRHSSNRSYNKLDPSHTGAGKYHHNDHLDLRRWPSSNQVCKCIACRITTTRSRICWDRSKGTSGRRKRRRYRDRTVDEGLAYKPPHQGKSKQRDRKARLHRNFSRKCWSAYRTRSRRRRLRIR